MPCHFMPCHVMSCNIAMVCMVGMACLACICMYGTRMVWYGKVWYGMACYGLVWNGTERNGMYVCMSVCMFACMYVNITVWQNIWPPVLCKKSSIPTTISKCTFPVLFQKWKHGNYAVRSFAGSRKTCIQRFKVAMAHRYDIPQHSDSVNTCWH